MGRSVVAPEAGTVSLIGVSKSFGKTDAVRDVTLEIGAGEFVSLLGPSGSGKTTTLQILAGLLAPDSGRVLVDSRDVTQDPAHRRDIGFVFQNYALFPHMTVRQNVAFPLRMRRLGAAERDELVLDALRRVELGDFGDRLPTQLSGGQQQRVALARAIVFSPPLLLMDEPLGALDRQLRVALQREIVRVTRQVGITCVYVTHDQEEALGMSDRVAVFADGGIVQVGTPREIYRAPRTEFVANFVGEANLIRGTFRPDASRPLLHVGERAIQLGAVTVPDAALAKSGGPAALVVRPEALGVARRNGEQAPTVDRERFALLGTVEETVFVGATARVIVATEMGTFMSRLAQDAAADVAQPGTAVTVGWRFADACVVSAGEVA
jgi:spermidine/putrescine ABC transporter ATP-binding subunit